MAKTLLDGVNEVLKRAGWIEGDSDELTSLTESARQHVIDVTVQVWNEAIDTLYDQSRIPRTPELAENTITLATDDRDYALQSDLLQLRFPLIDETNGFYIHEAKGGYLAIVNSQQIPGDFKGLPQIAAIRPTDGELYMDRIPTSEENGRVYKYRYDKDQELTTAAAAMPFSDAVFRGMVPAVAQLLRRDLKNDFDAGTFGSQIGQASRFLSQGQLRAKW
ncbi:MAG: hypothetical protein ACR2OV_15820 [Hyphomicrobiaceae bacterium]